MITDNEVENVYRLRSRRNESTRDVSEAKCAMRDSKKIKRSLNSVLVGVDAVGVVVRFVGSEGRTGTKGGGWSWEQQ